MELYIWLMFVFLMSMAGSIVVFFINNKYLEKNMSLYSGIAVGVMLATTIWSLMIPSFEYTNKFILIVLAFSFGFVVLLLFECFSKRRTNAQHQFTDETYLAITIHNIPEGLIIGVGFGALQLTNNSFGAIALALAIGIQNFPESISLSIILKEKGFSNKKIFKMSFISAIAEPIFGVVGYLLSYYIIHVLGVVLSFTAGMMMFVILSEMIVDVLERNKTYGMIGFLIGFILMMILEKIL